jgi:hypothetical protein
MQYLYEHFRWSMVFSNGMYFIYISAKLKHVKIIIIKYFIEYILLYIMLRGPPSLYSKFGLYFNSFQCEMMFANL